MCVGAGPSYSCLSGLWLFVVSPGQPALRMLRLGKVKETHRKKKKETMKKYWLKLFHIQKLVQPSDLTGEEALNE